MLTRSVTAMVSEQQGRLLDQVAEQRQISLSAVVRDAIREYLSRAALPRAKAAQ